jgi:hypothetical protein
MGCGVTITDVQKLRTGCLLDREEDRRRTPITRAADNGLISLLARADSPNVCVVRREAPLRSMPGLALSRAIAPHPQSPRSQAPGSGQNGSPNLLATYSFDPRQSASFWEEKAADTGLTRGKRLVVLVGQKKAVAITVRSVSGWQRWSKLAQWLAPGQEG